MTPRDAMTSDRSIDFELTRNMVRDFAVLCGDVSSLHMDAAFGRRSIFRSNVVHGMLPVMGVIFVLHRVAADRFVTMSKLTASFARPVSIGDRVRLCVDCDGAHDRLSYTVNNSHSGVALTHGTVALCNDRSARMHSDPADRADAPTLVAEHIAEANFSFDEIQRDQEDGFNVDLGASHAETLIRLLCDGADGVEYSDELLALREATFVRQFLGASLFSTFVGVCLPGRRATFLNCSLDFAANADWSRPSRLDGHVVFKSESTQTVIERISLRNAHSSGPILIDGRVNVRINDPPTIMPSMNALADAYGTLGLRDKVVLITGASRGLGETMAKLFAVHKCKVIVNYHRGKDDAEGIVNEIRHAGGTAISCEADVCDRSAVETMIESAMAQFGDIDVLVNNAVRDFVATDFLDLTWEDVERDIDIIVKGAFYCSQAVLPRMVARSCGKIINIGTLATDDPPSRHAKYVVAKSGLLGLTRSLASEFASSNIQVNMVTPSMVDTDLTSGISKSARRQIAGNTPMSRLANPGEVAAAVVLLASSYSSFTTGQRIMVTGGLRPYL